MASHCESWSKVLKNITTLWVVKQGTSNVITLDTERQNNDRNWPLRLILNYLTTTSVPDCIPSAVRTITEEWTRNQLWLVSRLNSGRLRMRRRSATYLAAATFAVLHVAVRYILFTVRTCGGVELKGEFHATANLIPTRSPISTSNLQHTSKFCVSPVYRWDRGEGRGKLLSLQRW